MTMTTDLSMLVWTAGFTAILWLPYILAHIANVGLVPVLTYRADDTPLPDWARRAKRAHYNAIESLVPFAALAIVAQLTGAANEATAAAAVAYFWARVAHYVLFVGNVPFGRTACFAIGWAAMLCIFWQIVT
ncbi:MAG: MAPEG family protein [Kiloniellales bacterium]